MRVFVGWSGKPALHIANALQEWLPNVDQALQPWTSEVGIKTGEQWRQKIDSELSDDETKAGVFVVTPANAESPWMHWEAGFLSGLRRRVCPYAFGYKNAGAVSELWGWLQVSLADEVGTLKLVESLAELHDGELNRIHVAFRKMWPELDEQLKSTPEQEKPKDRSIDERLDEILLLLRRQPPPRPPDDDSGAAPTSTNRPSKPVFPGSASTLDAFRSLDVSAIRSAQEQMEKIATDPAMQNLAAQAKEMSRLFEASGFQRAIEQFRKLKLP